MLYVPKFLLVEYDMFPLSVCGCGLASPCARVNAALPRRRCSRPVSERIRLDCTGSICCWIPVRPQCWTVSKRVLTAVVKPSRCLEERKTQIIATVLSVGLSALSGFIFHLHIIDCESWVWSNLINNSALVLFWVFSGPSGQSSLYVKMKNMLLPFLCTYWYLFAFN